MCSGLSYITLNVPVHDPRWGKAFLCPQCKGGERVQDALERNREKTLNVLSSAGLDDTPRHDWLAWEHFTREYLGGDVVEGKDLAISLAQAWGDGRQLTYDIFGDDHPLAQMYPTTTRFRPTHNLYITGEVGTGKTALATLAYKTRLAQGGAVGVSVEWVKLYEAIRSQYGKRDNQSYPIVQAVANASILFLDDLGHEGRRFTDNQFDVAWSIINARYTNMKPTIITSNLSRHDLGDALSHKISGRVAEAFVIVEMGGVGLREFDAAVEADPGVPGEGIFQGGNG